MKKIIVNERANDFHACIEGEPGKWGCGRSPDEAIGSLIRAWPDDFNIKTEVKRNYPESKI